MTKIVALAFAVIFGLCLPVYPQTAPRSNEMEVEARMRNLGQLENRVKARDERDRRLLRSDDVVRLTKEQKERVLRLRKINSEDVEKYKGFLRSEKTGIFRLFPNFDCVTPNTVKIDGECSQFVHESYAFSFRTGEYADTNYHDLTINHGEIFSDAFFAQGIFVPLGNTPLEGINTDHPAFAYLTQLAPESDISGAKKAASRFEAGHEASGFTYSNRIKTPAENMSYALRVIAYKCANAFAPPTVDSSMTELKFLSLVYDERADLTVVFRIVRKDADGALTILWKELSRKDAPKIKFGKNEVREDFKAANFRKSN